MTKTMTHGSSALALDYDVPSTPIPATTSLAPLLSFPIVEKPVSPSYSKDDAGKYFSNPSDMLTFLEEREDNAKWIIGANIRSLSVMLVEDACIIHNAVPDEIFLDTAKNTGLVLQGEYLPQTALRSCAISSLQERAKISGAALGKVSKKVLRNILNDCLDVAPKKAVSKIRIADGKISAVLSSEYVPLPMPEIFEAAIDYIDKRFPNNAFAGGMWSHIITSAEWQLSGENELIAAYKEALTKHGIEHDGIQPGLRLSSSDIGVSGVNLMPKLVVGKDRLLLPLGGPIGLEHKGEAKMSKFMENLEGVFAQYGDRLSKLAKLLDVGIAYPKGCMKGVLKRLGIPKKYSEATLEVFAWGFSDDEGCTAHDIYYGLGNLMLQLQGNKATGEQVLRMEETIAKAITLNFSEYDRPCDDE